MIKENLGACHLEHRMQEKVKKIETDQIGLVNTQKANPASDAIMRCVGLEKKVFATNMLELTLLNLFWALLLSKLKGY